MFSVGGEYMLTSGAYRSVHKEGSLNAGALSLRRNDILQTGPGCFVELYLEPDGTRINMVENTSLVYKGPGRETLSVSFEMMYGRMRVSNVGIMEHEGVSSVFVKAGEAEAVFRRGDAAIDFIVNSEIAHMTQAEPLLTVYNFSGGAELRPTSWMTNAANGTKESMPGFAAHEYESLTMETADSRAYIVRKPLDDGIIHYWNRNNFTGRAPLLTPRYVASVPVDTQSDGSETPQVRERIVYYPQSPPQIIEYIYPDNPFHKRLFRAKNFLLSTGMIFTLGGVGMQIAGAAGVPSLDANSNKMLFNFGYVPLVIGLIFNGAALVINPQNMEKNGSN